MADRSISFKIKKEEKINIKNHKESECKEGNGCHSSGFPLPDSDISLKKETEQGSIFIDHLGAEIEESDIDSHSEYEVVSFLISDDEEMLNMNCQDSKKGKRRRRSSGDGSMDMQKKMRGTLEHTKQANHCKASTLKTNKGENGSSQTQKDSYQDSAHCENASMNTQSLQEKANGNILPTDNDVNNAEFLSSPPDTRQNQTSFSCSKCDKTYSVKADLTRHMRQHKKGGPYTCNDCGKQFLQRGSIINHYRTHTGEKPFACVLCQKSFNRKDYLDAHLRTHTGERPYKCTVCEKRFTQKGELNQHRRRHTR